MSLLVDMTPVSAPIERAADAVHRALGGLVGVGFLVGLPVVADEVGPALPIALAIGAALALVVRAGTSVGLRSPWSRSAELLLSAGVIALCARVLVDAGLLGRTAESLLASGLAAGLCLVAWSLRGIASRAGEALDHRVVQVLLYGFLAVCFVFAQRFEATEVGPALPPAGVLSGGATLACLYSRARRGQATTDAASLGVAMVLYLVVALFLVAAIGMDAVGNRLNLLLEAGGLWLTLPLTVALALNIARLRLAALADRPALDLRVPVLAAALCFFDADTVLRISACAFLWPVVFESLRPFGPKSALAGVAGVAVVVVGSFAFAKSAAVIAVLTLTERFVPKP